jgi:hypothetical protein
MSRLDNFYKDAPYGCTNKTLAPGHVAGTLDGDCKDCDKHVERMSQMEDQ